MRSARRSACSAANSFRKSANAQRRGVTDNAAFFPRVSVSAARAFAVWRLLEPELSKSFLQASLNAVTTGSELKMGPRCVAHHRDLPRSLFLGPTTLVTGSYLTSAMFPCLTSRNDQRSSQLLWIGACARSRIRPAQLVSFQHSERVIVSGFGQF